MRGYIFIRGKQLFKEGKVKLDIETEKAIYLKVEGRRNVYDVRLMSDGTFNCTCRSGSIKGAVYGSLCSHVVAAILYVAKMKKGKRKRGIVSKRS